MIENNKFKTTSEPGVKFVKNKRAKRISITVKPFRGIRVTLPFRVSLKEGAQFLESQSQWVQKTIIKIREVEKDHIAAKNNDAILIYSVEARRALIERLNTLALRFGFEYGRVFIRNQKTRWGSCSGKNNINLNITLMRLDENLRDYVILHELVHTRIKNHSKDFWSELDKYTGRQAKELNKQLRKYHPS